MTRGDKMEQQMDIDQCLIENARKNAIDSLGVPFFGAFNWAESILDLIRIIEGLEKEKELFRAAVIRRDA